MKGLRPIDLTFGAVFVCLMAIGANIAVWFPWLAVPIGGASVPLSLQTFFAILAGLMLGKRLGTFSMLTYIFVGVCGVPVFAGMKAGPFILASPTGGFILSFIAVAFFVGLLVEQRERRPSVPWYSFSAGVGLLCNYGIGVTYMYFIMHLLLHVDISYLVAWTSMVPFMVKDTALAFLASLFMVTIAKRIPLQLLHPKVSHFK